MSPKEKAKELVDGFWGVMPSLATSKKAALICVDEILNDYTKKGRDTIFGQGEYCESPQYTFWRSVKQEIQKL